MSRVANDDDMFINDENLEQLEGHIVQGGRTLAEIPVILPNGYPGLALAGDSGALARLHDLVQRVHYREIPGTSLRSCGPIIEALWSTSVVCRLHVEGTSTMHPDAVVDRMEIAHYLHNYCDFSFGLQIAYAWLRAHTNGVKLPKPQWRVLVNKCAMLTTDMPNKFPVPWPWHLGFSPGEWMQMHSVTPRIV
jgi:hypothetical protein